MSLHPSLFHMKIVSESRTFPAELSAEIRPLPPDPDRLWYNYINKELTELTDDIFPSNIASIAYYQFQNQTHLSNLSLTNVETINPWAFSNCGIDLDDDEYLIVNLPNASQISTRAFHMAKVKEITLPALQTIPTYCFYECTSLTKADFQSARMLAAYAFYNCLNLQSVILRNTNEVVSLAHINAFSGTPITSGTGYIYVPSALYNDYINDRVWSTFANQIRTIEDYNQ